MKIFFWGGGGRGGGGSGRGGRGWGSQGGCEQRIEVFVKIKKKMAGSGWRGGGGGQGGCERRIEISVKIQKKKNLGGGGKGRGRVWGVRVDVIEELKSFLGKFTKKKFRGGGVGLGGGGGQGGCE